MIFVLLGQDPKRVPSTCPKAFMDAASLFDVLLPRCWGHSRVGSRDILKQLFRSQQEGGATESK